MWRITTDNSNSRTQHINHRRVSIIGDGHRAGRRIGTKEDLMNIENGIFKELAQKAHHDFHLIFPQSSFRFSVLKQNY